MSKFNVASDEEVLSGETTDVYFLRAEEVLRRSRKNPRVVAEVGLHREGAWGVLAGVNDAARLLEGRNVDAWAMPEGTLFFADEPVLRLSGRYLDFARLETPLLGLLCQASGIATKAARVRLAAGDREVISFGTRRVHPALAKIVERAAFIGGVDGVSNVAGARSLSLEPRGTMPHSLVLCIGDPRRAFAAFDRAVDRSVPRICLVDTFGDEKTEAVAALETLGRRLAGVRIDTPSSRRGNLRRILQEVRWELDLRGGKRVKLYLSGGLGEEEVARHRDLVDGFGVGTSIASAPPVDFALDIVEVESRPLAKRGKRGGAKQVYRDPPRLEDTVLPLKAPRPPGKTPLLEPRVRRGVVLREDSVKEARQRALRQLSLLAKIGSARK